jgi:hypothetical protein
MLCARVTIERPETFEDFLQSIDVVDELYFLIDLRLKILLEHRKMTKNTGKSHRSSLNSLKILYAEHYRLLPGLPRGTFAP